MGWTSSQLYGTALVALVTLILYLLFGKKRVFLDKDKFKALKLIEKETLTHNTKRFRFALPGGTRLGLPVGQHISFQAEDAEGRQILRSYTPVTGDEHNGYVDFVIKVYPGGKMSQYVDRLKINDNLMMRGPKGRFTYTCNMKKSFGMIAGGTGITPMYQVAREILRNPCDTTCIQLLFANVSVDDILIREEIQKLAERHPQRFQVHYVLDRAPENWTGSKGYITAEMITAHCPAPSGDSMLLFCGPPPMTKSVEALVKQLGFSQSQYFCF